MIAIINLSSYRVQPIGEAVRLFDYQLCSNELLKYFSNSIIIVLSESCRQPRPFPLSGTMPVRSLCLRFMWI